ncbi:MAG: Maf family protein, partial [Thermodesulfobacteriota bacterium]
MNHDLPQGPFRTSRNLVLASASPRRQHLLAALGLHFVVQPGSFKEPQPDPGVPPQQYVLDMARLKAGRVAAQQTDSVILAADTAVVLGEKILGKPLGKKEALTMLLSLSGRTHAVLTACCILDTRDEAEETFVVSTDVSMARYPPSVLESYVDSGESFDKAGSYAIQGSGCFLVSSIQGSCSNVIGLPVQETLA